MAKILFNIYCKIFEYSLKTLHNTVQKKNKKCTQLCHTCDALALSGPAGESCFLFYFVIVFFQFHTEVFIDNNPVWLCSFLLFIQQHLISQICCLYLVACYLLFKCLIAVTQQHFLLPVIKNKNKQKKQVNHKCKAQKKAENN